MAANRGFIITTLIDIGEERTMETLHVDVHPSILRLKTVQDLIRREGGYDIARKIDDLLMRLQSPKPQVFVAFCGLFSAGKSSLLNALCEANQLATGAVPTTAVTQEIPLPGTDEQVVLMDTPGVDSTDEAHQQETDAAIHRADVIALVMDYQHVESEANLELARRFTDLSQPLVIIVNQVDKHLEWELPFHTFVRRIEQTFEDWDIHYDRLFFTSTHKEAAHNQLAELVSYLSSLRNEAATTQSFGVINRLNDLVVQHVTNTMDHERALLEEALIESIGYVPFDEAEARMLKDERMARIAEIQSKVEQATREVVETFETRRQEWLREVELSQIAPYETTERGRLYVESLRPDFKVGWFRAKQKTAEEQDARLAAFVSDLKERTQNYLLMPLRNRMREFLQSAASAKETWMSQIDSISVVIDKSLCQSTVKSGALVSDEYPYQYVKDVVSRVKGQVISQVNQCIEGWLRDAVSSCESSLSSMLDERQRLEADIRTLDAWLELDNKKTNRIAELMSQGADMNA
jgi:small GTP-binding protein